MSRTIGLYALALGAFAFFLDWIEYRYMMRDFSTEFFIVVIAVIFTAFGAWSAWKLVPHKDQPPFEPNKLGVTETGLSQREQQVLKLLARGQTNKEIAKDLGLAPDTVKSHLSNIYRKLNVNRRTQAIQRARDLLVIP